MKTIKLKNSQLATFKKSISYAMTFTQGRLRNRFLNLIVPVIDEVENNRVEICEKLAEKNEDGLPSIADGKYIFTPENDIKVNDEINALMAEYAVIDVPTAMRGDIGGIKHMIELSTVVLTPKEQDDAEEILIALSNPPEKKKKS